jgi:hypothetical protein
MSSVIQVWQEYSNKNVVGKDHLEVLDVDGRKG